MNLIQPLGTAWKGRRFTPVLVIFEERVMLVLAYLLLFFGVSALLTWVRVASFRRQYETPLAHSRAGRRLG